MKTLCLLYQRRRRSFKRILAYCDTVIFSAFTPTLFAATVFAL
jgi:hypothetical protein